MIEDGVPEVAQAKRLGHRPPGVRGIYSHVSAKVEQRLVDGWEQTCSQPTVGDNPSDQVVLTRGADNRSSEVVTRRQRRCSQNAPNVRPAGETGPYPKLGIRAVTLGYRLWAILGSNQ
jgi:hypothetical protein